MRLSPTLVIALCLLPHAALAQGKPQPRPPQSETPSSTSDAKAAETKKQILSAEERQNVVDARDTKRWGRWAFAVCIGCGPLPAKYRAVFTNPVRVLAGISAADDDDRNVRAQRRRLRMKFVSLMSQ